MPKDAFSHVTTWVFDLDNTLYHPSARLFDQIEVRMTDWVMRTLGLGQAEADQLRKDYWHNHGTTLAGLMREHDVDPLPYLTEVHEIDLSHMERDPVLADRITALPGRKIVYTNGSGPYAERVLESRGLAGRFDAIYGIEHAGFRPKPDRDAYDVIFGTDGLDPSCAAMFEDDPRNLAQPHAMGLRCVHVAEAPVTAPHVHFHTDDLSGFLARVI
ncbi:pyrimidine 5'-nucleotidase [Pseudooceanicola algae]|uniref:Uncharacterized protein n=1 Tax=Pseudooceanicola algae TaxID=1537215 RepID=A0A418SEV8_9RHOB|nr:pyrimidine 5'-nucleotidase [Pseudooceanicola algae]QPM89070.1 hypothetical protein PSAL_002790 [Pseudooceanicola algae]